MNTCEWRKTHIFPNEYLVSSEGQIKSIRSDKILKPSTDKDGYLYYVLCVKGNRKTIKAHRLVAKAFIENPLNKPAIDHINGIKTDNRVENLRWVTNKENTNNPITLERVVSSCMKRIDILKQKSIDRNYGRRRTIVLRNGVIVGEYLSQKDASEHTGVSKGKISSCLNGRIKSCKGYEFRRFPEREDE